MLNALFLAQSLSLVDVCNICFVVNSLVIDDAVIFAIELFSFVRGLL